LVSYTYEIVYGSAPFSIALRLSNLIPAIETAQIVNPFFLYHQPVPSFEQSTCVGTVPLYLVDST
jgi:hypothetical protein